MKIGPIEVPFYLFLNHTHALLQLRFPGSTAALPTRIPDEMAVATAHMLLNVYRLNLFYFWRGS